MHDSSMMGPRRSAEEPQLTPRAHEIVAAARSLLEQEGIDALSMRSVAARLGIRAPSLYEHLSNKESLVAALISEGFGEWTELAERALQEGADPLVAIGRVYRGYAQRHPHLYRLMTSRPLVREALNPGVEKRAAQPAIDAAGGDGDLARALWSFAHGMVINELNDRFPIGADLDAAWQRGLSAFRREAAGEVSSG